jgi:hypothetical protein
VQAFTPSRLNLLYVGGLIATVTAIIGIVGRPVKMGVSGILLLGLAVYLTPAASFLPTLLMEGFLGGYVMMYNQVRQCMPPCDAEDVASSVHCPSSQVCATTGE